MTSLAASTWFLALGVEPGPWFSSLPLPPDQTRLLHPEDLHVTLAYLDRCGEERALAAWSAFRWPLGSRTVTLGEVTPLGNPRHPSALSALVAAGRAELEAAMGESRDLPIEVAGAPQETRPPKAHVTIARISRSASSADRERALAWSASLDLGAPTLLLDRLALYASRSGPEGRRYARVREITIPVR